jgi:CRP/FNR family cyclic AMP-dependent transcriptional regulator
VFAGSASVGSTVTPSGIGLTGRKSLTGLRSSPHAHTARVSICHVLREDPGLAEAVSPPERARAIEHCVARTAHLPRGRWRTEGAAVVHSGIGLLVLEGLLLRRVGVDGQFGAELLGEGDLLRPWQEEHAEATLISTTGWRVLSAARVALLDEEAERRFAAFPALIGGLVGRAVERSRNLSVNMAIVHQARVKLRLHALFWHLAERWGRVGVEGVILPLGLTHSVLADLVAARRPTVTSALTELARAGLIRPYGEGWLLSGDPPGELLEIQDMALTAASPG